MRMHKPSAVLVALSLIIGGVAAGVVWQADSPEQAWETIAAPLGFETGDEDGEREIVVQNPTFTASTGRFDNTTVASTSGISLKRVPASRPSKQQRDTLRPEAPKVRPATQPAAVSDPVQQTAVVGAAPTLGTGFTGMNLNSNGCGWPPDTTGDVGGTTGQYYVQAVNCSVAVYNTSNGTVAAGPWTLDDFMKGAMGASSSCAANNQGDPVVSYDVAAQRWIVMDFWWTSYSGPYQFCIAVSNTSDPTGAWHGYAYTTTLGGTTTTSWLPDYPRMSVTPNGVAITANMFANASNYAGVGVYLLDRTSLFCNPAPGVTCSLKSFRWQLGTGYFSLLPANVRFPVASGAASKVGAFLASDYGLSSSVRMWTIAKPDWTGTVAPALNGPVTVAVPAFSRASGSPTQPGTSRKLDSLGDRLMQNVQVADSATTANLLLSRSVGVGNGNKLLGVRWQTISWTAATTSFAAGKGTTYAPNDSTFRWMPSAAINSKGEVAIGYSRSSSSVFPEVRIAGATATSVASATPTTDIAEVVVRTGAGSQTTYGRWGDYASMSVDPAGCKFWFTTEYYSATGTNWRTWIQPVTLTSCP